MDVVKIRKQLTYADKRTIP